MKEIFTIFFGLLSIPVLAIKNLGKEYIEKVDAEIVEDKKTKIDEWDRYFKNIEIPLEVREEYLING